MKVQAEFKQSASAAMSGKFPAKILTFTKLNGCHTKVFRNDEPVLPDLLKNQPLER